MSLEQRYVGETIDRDYIRERRDFRQRLEDNFRINSSRKREIDRREKQREVERFHKTHNQSWKNEFLDQRNGRHPIDSMESNVRKRQ